MKDYCEQSVLSKRNKIPGILICLLVLWISNSATARGVMGKQAVLEITTLNDKRISLKQYRGKMVLVTFWATWCGTCVVELPELQKFYVKHKQQFELVAVSVDRTLDVVGKFSKKHNLTYPVAWLDAKDTKSNFDNIQTTPTMFVVDPNGKVVKKLFGHISEAKLKQLLKTYGS